MKTRRIVMGGVLAAWFMHLRLLHELVLQSNKRLFIIWWSYITVVQTCLGVKVVVVVVIGRIDYLKS